LSSDRKTAEAAFLHSAHEGEHPANAASGSNPLIRRGRR
jgi:hypothetical protein